METNNNNDNFSNPDFSENHSSTLFDEKNANMENIKKPWFWIILISVSIIVASLLGNLFNTPSPNTNENPDSSSNSYTATMGERMALSSAKNYLRTMGFSKTRLINQLEYEGYSTSEATYAVNNCGANWKEQAVRVAKNYLNTMAFSKQRLIDQLEYEGFTSEEAKYGADQAYK